jgi:CHAT domain-containing protein
MVSQEKAPGLPPIPGTKDEIARIAALLKGEPDIAAIRLEDEACTKEAVLASMESHNCIHLACHGSQNEDKPMKSSFALYDGRLEISSIIECNLKHADFAFLSACETSTGDVTLSNEALHLAGAMLAVGYQGVVATMWSIQDLHAPQVAEDFYRELLIRSGEFEGRKRLDSQQAAYALHHAVRELRKRVGDSNYLAWVPYVHFGL